MRPHPRFPKYIVCRDGRIWSTKSEKWINGWADRAGHLRVDFEPRGVGRGWFIHRAVLETFVGPCPEGMECRHLDGNPKNNRLENLCWGTRSEIQKDSVRLGSTNALTLDSGGERNGLSKLTASDVKRIIWCYFKGGVSEDKLAKIYKVSDAAIYNILGKRYWAPVWEELTWI